MKVEQEPIAFGLKALKITFVADESKGSTEALEQDIKTISGVNSVEVVDLDNDGTGDLCENGDKWARSRQRRAG